MSPLVKIQYWVAIVLALLAIPLWALTIAEFDTFYVLIPLVILMQIYLVYRLNRVQTLLIGFLYLFLYFLFFIPYFYLSLDLSQYYVFQKKIYFSQALFSFYVFYAGSVLGAIKDINSSGKPLKDRIIVDGSRNIAYIFFCFLLLLILLVFKQGDNVLYSDSPYEAYRDNLTKSSALPLLITLLIFFVPYLFSFSKWKKWIFGACIFIMLIYSITRGFRMVLAPLGLLFFFYFFEQKIKTKYVILVFILGFIFMGVINSLKMNQTFKLKYLFTENDEYVASHHADNLYVSASAEGVVDKGLMTFEKRVLLSIGFLGESIIPPSFFPDYMKYPHAVHALSSTGGGGLFLSGAYLMWGYLGVFLFGYLLISFFRKVYEHSNGFLPIIGGIILIFIPRWMSYDFHVILRFTVLSIIIYWLLNHVKIYCNFKIKFFNRAKYEDRNRL